MAHGFKTWQPNTSGAATTMNSIATQGYANGDVIEAAKVNAPIKQANLIGVGLIDALGITDALNADSAVTAVADAIETNLETKIAGTTVTNATNATNAVNAQNASYATQAGAALTMTQKSIGGSAHPVYITNLGDFSECSTLLSHTITLDFSKTDLSTKFRGTIMVNRVKLSGSSGDIDNFETLYYAIEASGAIASGYITKFGSEYGYVVTGISALYDGGIKIRISASAIGTGEAVVFDFSASDTISISDKYIQIR